MPIIQPDTSEMEDLSPIEDGTYPARVHAGTAQKSKEKQTDLFVPTFKVKVGDKERTRKAYMPISGAGSFNFDQFLRAVGEGDLADQIRSGAKPPIDTDMFNGKELNLVIGKNMYQGQVRDEIKGYLPA